MQIIDELIGIASRGGITKGEYNVSEFETFDKNLGYEEVVQHFSNNAEDSKVFILGTLQRCDINFVKRALEIQPLRVQ